jgi:cation-transporting ATPase 13A2
VQVIERDSTELVPGDLVNLSNYPSTTVPADLLLLSGDAILNESMLTGESVPVSKIPAKEEDLVQWREHNQENSKCMLYGGTKIIRIRGTANQDGTEKAALALVLRTGKSSFLPQNLTIDIT